MKFFIRSSKDFQCREEENWKLFPIKISKKRFSCYIEQKEKTLLQFHKEKYKNRIYSFDLPYHAALTKNNKIFSKVSYPTKSLFIIFQRKGIKYLWEVGSWIDLSEYNNTLRYQLKNIWIWRIWKNNKKRIIQTK